VIARLVDLPNDTVGEDIRLQIICESLDRLLNEARKAVLDHKINHFDAKQLNSFMRYKTFTRPVNVKIQHSTFLTYRISQKDLDLRHPVSTAKKRTQKTFYRD